MVIRPYGYALWERMQFVLDQMIKAAGVANAYFPIFIPESFLKKEKEHVEGFSPELAVVTIGGGKKLEEKLVVRPTSETIIYNKFSDWIHSWRDLPYKINQWSNIVRWEKRTYFFLRTTEFLWQEGHTAHADHQGAVDEARRALKMYTDFFQDYLAMPGIAGKKSPFDKFPGALDTFAFESLMPNGKALQSCTSHDLGQNFAKPFAIQFQDKNGDLKHVWQTCWGLSTRAIGGLIMVHGDDQGLVLPPKIAPTQIIIIPILGSEAEDNKKALKESKKICQQLIKSGLRVKIDDREEHRPGYKFNYWELRGVPLRIEIGRKETEGGLLTLARRDNKQKVKVEKEKVVARVRIILAEVQAQLYNQAKSFLEDNTCQAEDYDQFKRLMKEKKGFIKAFWCGKKDCEEKIKQETKASSRCLPFSASKEESQCFHCRQPASFQWIFAQAY